MQKTLLTWYELHSRDLPWRGPEASPWGVLVSEVMLQQTPVARVLPVWGEWMLRWPTPGALADAPVGEAIRHWGRLGYPRRALRLHCAAVRIRDDHEGRIPRDHAALLALPGVGEYTASAVASFAFGQRFPVVDTNVRRVHARAISGTAQPALSLSAAERALARESLPEDPDLARRWNVACMELGALICTARSPVCSGCPLETGCAWVLAGRPAYDGPPRRGQTWHGTDRQVRGKILQLVRDAAAPVPRSHVDLVWPDAGQVDQCLASLLHDGLLDLTEDQQLTLP